MPKSKRSKVVNLTNVKSKRKDLKRDLVVRLQESFDKYAYAYVFTYENMRTNAFKNVRAAWVDSRFFLGKNKIMQKALGETAADAYRPALDSLSGDLVGNVGLLLTDRKPAEVQAAFEEFAEADFPRAGFVPTESITVPKGKLVDMPHTMAATLSKLGMPVRLERGIVVLPAEHTICTAGEAITPEQGRLLKQFGHNVAVFRLHMISSWHKGKYTSTGYTGHLKLRDDKDEGDAEGGAGAEEEEEESEGEVSE